MKKINRRKALKNLSIGIGGSTLLSNPLRAFANTKTNLGQTLSTNTVGVQQPLSDSLSSDLAITDESDTLIYESGKDLNFVVAATDYFLTDPDISKLKIKVSTNGINRTHRNLELGTSHFRVR